MLGVSRRVVYGDRILVVVDKWQHRHGHFESTRRRVVVTLYNMDKDSGGTQSAVRLLLTRCSTDSISSWLVVHGPTLRPTGNVLYGHNCLEYIYILLY